MTQQKQNGNIVAIIVMIFLFGMISFVTNLASPMGDILKFNSEYLIGWELSAYLPTSSHMQ
jgi:hypothetical protein